MFKHSVQEPQPIGLDLFTDAETFLTELSEDDESMITGGANSVSNSGLSLLQRRRRIQIRIQRQRRQRIRRRMRIRARRRAAANSTSGASLT